jgi:kinase-associated protein B
MQKFEVGQLISAKYKTGKYIGEVNTIEDARILVKILAVVKHPTQGDLHAPKQTDVALFHQRKALAQFEKAWMPLSTCAVFEGETPTYKESLKQAISDLETKLMAQKTGFAEESLKCLAELKKDYQL